MKKDRKFQDQHRLPRPLVFGILFMCSFLPGVYGKASAALAGLVISLYVLEIMRGKKRYVLALILPALNCILVRYASHGTYTCITDNVARDAAAEKAKVFAHYAGLFAGTIGRYGARLWETLQASWEAIIAFRETPSLNSLAPAAEYSQFLIILLSVFVCLIAVFRNKSRSC
jgi:hypothetical protein